MINNSASLLALIGRIELPLTSGHMTTESDAILFTLIAAVNWDGSGKVIDNGIVNVSL